MKYLMMTLSAAMIALGSVSAMADNATDKAAMEKAAMAKEAAMKEKAAMEKEMAMKEKAAMEKAKMEKAAMAKEKMSKDAMAKEAAMKEKAMMEEKAAMAGDYIIKRGDNLWNIAKAHYGDANMWTKIKKANKLGSGRRLKVGDTLKLPK